MNSRSWRHAPLLATCLALARSEFVPDGKLDEAATAAFDKPLMPPFPDTGSASLQMADLRAEFEGKLNETSSPEALFAQANYVKLMTRFKYGLPPTSNDADTNFNEDGAGGDVGIAAGSAVRLIVHPRRDGKFVTRKGGKAQIFHFVGTNNYGLATSYVYTRGQVTQFMSEMAATGIKVVRTWCFGNGYGDYEPWHRPTPFQGAVGAYSEEAFAHLDYVIHQASIHGIRLVCTLGNSLPDFGGIDWYVNKLAGGGAKQQFYDNDACKTWYKNYVKHVVTRVNTISGRKYANEPAIFAWQLLNEPNLDMDYEKRRGVAPGTLLREWVCEMSDYIKSLGVRQMISIGDEGFRIDGRTNVPHMAWMNGGSKGADFVGNLRCPSVSYATVHWYPETFAVAPNNATAFTRDFLADRAEIARALGKPIVLEEYGMTVGYSPSRNELFEGIHRVAQYHGYAGTMVWQLYPSGLLPANSVMDFSLSMDGGAALSGHINWTNERNVRWIKTPPPVQPPCVDFRGDCASKTNGGKCWDYIAGECMATCNQCGNWKGWDASKPGPKGREPRIIQ